MTHKGQAVHVRIHTLITDGDRQESHTMEAGGRLLQGSGLLVIRFTEPKEAGERPTTQQIKCTESEMTVRRQGQVTMNQRFSEGVTTEGVYETPELRMPMETTTTRLSQEWDDVSGRGEIALSYDLVLQGEKTGRYDMTITLKEATAT
ncbi:Domain of unknown function DUF1934 [[Bacillus] selenitireducens MLS10]|uniref:DUF1934 domain-containing protein n=2 Tax=Salisediminibacterium selenitireducens TaxID=85683 RepID=D6Y199_BACIE|nr:Domain of unknown function DUF1934 [[Bacillus] selenitireducens MLS10]